MDPQSAITIGVLLLALVTVESGGLFMKRVVQGREPANELQRSFYRAGHAHAAVLLILGIAIVPAAAVLMPAGFFLSVTGRNPEKPNRLIVLLWVGVVSLTLGLLASGVAMLVSGIAAARS